MSLAQFNLTVRESRCYLAFISAQSRRLVLQRLLEDGAEVRPGYTLEYCALTSMDLHGAVLQATLQAAAGD